MLTIVLALLFAQPQLGLAGGRPVPVVEGSTLLARVKGDARVTLRLRPGGPVVAVVGSRTPFGSPRVFSIVERRGPWVAVRAPEVPNGSVGWIDSRRGLFYRRTAYEVEVDLSRHLLEVRGRTGVVFRATVGIGASESPTPSGRFAITDKIRGSRYGAAFGCCILALSGNQTRLPAGWVGGTRLAIHGTDRPGTIGSAASAGCLHASDEALRRLERLLPLGTPVVIHP